MRLFGKENPSWDERRKFVSDLHQQVVEDFNEKINSRDIRGNEKRTLIIFKNILVMNAGMQDSILLIWEKLEGLNKAIGLLGENLEKNQTKSQELEDTLSKLRTLLAEPRIAKVAEVMEQIEKKMQESKKASDAYNV